MRGFLAYIMPVDTGNEPVHPIAPGGQPPTIWPSPGRPTHPIAPGGPGNVVTHPIVPGVWPEPPEGGNGGGGEPPTGELPEVMDWHTVWSAEYGWALVGVPSGDHPTPSRKR